LVCCVFFAESTSPGERAQSGAAFAVARNVALPTFSVAKVELPLALSCRLLGFSAQSQLKSGFGT
jgi:hypothetical protein